MNGLPARKSRQFLLPSAARMKKVVYAGDRQPHAGPTEAGPQALPINNALKSAGFTQYGESILDKRIVERLLACTVRGIPS